MVNTTIKHEPFSEIIVIYEDVLAVDGEKTNIEVRVYPLLDAEGLTLRFEVNADSGQTLHVHSPQMFEVEFDALLNPETGA